MGSLPLAGDSPELSVRLPPGLQIEFRGKGFGLLGDFVSFFSTSSSTSFSYVFAWTLREIYASCVLGMIWWCRRHLISQLKLREVRAPRPWCRSVSRVSSANSSSMYELESFGSFFKKTFRFNFQFLIFVIVFEVNELKKKKRPCRELLGAVDLWMMTWQI